ncbi:MAG: GH39 family glycosyl hydrolase [Terracidiphilus sp.]
MPKRPLIALALCFLPALLSSQQTVQIRVHANRPDGLLPPVWAYVGHDEPNYTYSDEGRTLLDRLGQLSPYPFHDRTHNLLTTGNGAAALKWGSTNVYTLDAAGKPVYNWTILDRIFDTYKAAGITPYVELGFMPEALSSHPQPYRDDWPDGPLFTGWSYPPNNYQQWSDLVYHLVRHLAARYGPSNVEHWDFEVWNEPDIGYWHGTLAQYEKLYDYTAASVKRALPGAQVGGPASTGPASPHAAQFLRGFLTHCASGKSYATGETGTPLDFISFHAKGRTYIVDGHAQMDIAHNLDDVAHGFAIVASYPSLRHLPIVISESDPEGCAACAASLHPENAYRNTPQYASYEAELLQGTLALAARDHVNLQGYVTWAYTFPGHPYFYGYRSLATHGIDKPIMNAFRMFGMLQERRVEATGSGQLSLESLLAHSARAQPDIRAIATRGDRTVAVLVWNYDDNAMASPPAPIEIHIDGLPQNAARVLTTQFRIDDGHSDAYTVWKAMGSPQNPTAEQLARLRAAGQLELFTSPRWLHAQAGRLDLSLTLPRQALALILLHWRGPQ